MEIELIFANVGCGEGINMVIIYEFRKWMTSKLYTQFFKSVLKNPTMLKGHKPKSKICFKISLKKNARFAT